MAMKIDELVMALQAATGNDGISKEEDGSILFGLDEDMGVRMLPIARDGAEEPTKMSVSIVVGSVDETSSPALLMELLSANYMGAGTGGGTLAVDEESGLLVLQTILDLDDGSSVQEFVEDFAQLVGFARYFNGRIKKYSAVVDMDEDVFLKI